MSGAGAGAGAAGAGAAVRVTGAGRGGVVRRGGGRRIGVGATTSIGGNCSCAKLRSPAAKIEMNAQLLRSSTLLAPIDIESPNIVEWMTTCARGSGRSR
jgi:hypothetical protein